MIIGISILLLLYILIRYNSNKLNSNIKEQKQAFWNKEHKANDTRKKDISSLPYIQIPVDTLIGDTTDDKELEQYSKQLKHLSSQPILNLTGISNTDLKLQYGVANLTFLSQCDNSYTQLVSLIHKWGEYLYTKDNLLDAKNILEFGISCNTDITHNYTLLANIYKVLNEEIKIDDLILQATHLNTIRKDTIIEKLNAIKNS